MCVREFKIGRRQDRDKGVKGVMDKRKRKECLSGKFRNLKKHGKRVRWK